MSGLTGWSECTTCSKWIPDDDACPACLRARIEAETIAAVVARLRAMAEHYIDVTGEDALNREAGIFERGDWRQQ